MLDQRDKWIRKRFGNIDSSILGSVEELAPLTWPELERSYEVKGIPLLYKRVPVTEPYAERVADIFSQGAYEMIRNSELSGTMIRIESWKGLAPGTGISTGAGWRENSSLPSPCS